MSSVSILIIVAQQLQASVFYLLRSGFGAAARLQRVSGISSFGVGHVTVSVIRIPGLNIIESVFGLIWPYSSKTSPKLGLVTS